MLRKLTLAVCLLVAAVGSTEGTATASPVLAEGGTALAVNSSVAAGNDGNIEFVYGSGAIVCTSSELAGTLAGNSGTLIQWNVESGFWRGKASLERCVGPAAVGVTAEALPYCFESPALGTFVIKPKKCGSKEEGLITFRFNFEGIYECQYKRTNLSGTYKTAPEAATLTISNNAFAWTGVGSFLCRTTMTLNGSYLLKTPGGTSLTVS